MAIADVDWFECDSFKDILQPGNQLVAAGYCMYGSSTQLVLTWGKGVHGFTLDPTIGAFILSHNDIKIPDEPKTVRRPARLHIDRVKEPPSIDCALAMNRSTRATKATTRIGTLPPGHLLTNARTSPSRTRPDTLAVWCPMCTVRCCTEASSCTRPTPRYAFGSVSWWPHLFTEAVYSLDCLRLQSKTGKLRLLYEANPMSFIVEQAGGMSTTGTQRVLDLVPVCHCFVVSNGKRIALGSNGVCFASVDGHSREILDFPGLQTRCLARD